MKKIFLFIFAFTISFSQAQNADKAKAYLDEVYKKVTSYKNIYIDFAIRSRTLKNVSNRILEEM